MNIARYNFALHYANNRIYAFSGCQDTSSFCKECEIYDFNKKVWEIKATMERGRSNIVTHSIKELNKVLLIGGMEIFNPCPLV